ncbi:AtpZ/AtpI family protein [Thermodesulfobacteriota bacterium]
MSPREQGNAFTQFGYYTAMVTQMAMAMVGGVVLGNYLDGKFGIFPILTVLGTMLGMAVGIKNLVQMINYFKRKERENGRSGSDGESTGEE